METSVSQIQINGVEYVRADSVPTVKPNGKRLGFEMTHKIYKVRISFGDGNPMEDSISAKSGVLAQDIAMRRHPGARNVHLIGVDNRYEKPAPVAVKQSIPSPVTDIAGWERDRQISCCVHLHNEGRSQRSIAGYMGVSRSTIARWIKQYG